MPVCLAQSRQVFLRKIIDNKHCQCLCPDFLKNEPPRSLPTTHPLIPQSWCSFGPASVFEIRFFNLTFGSMQTEDTGICIATYKNAF